MVYSTAYDVCMNVWPVAVFPGDRRQHATNAIPVRLYLPLSMTTYMKPNSLTSASGAGILWKHRRWTVGGGSRYHLAPDGSRLLSLPWPDDVQTLRPTLLCPASLA